MWWSQPVPYCVRQPHTSDFLLCVWLSSAHFSPKTPPLASFGSTSSHQSQRDWTLTHLWKQHTASLLQTSHYAPLPSSFSSLCEFLTTGASFSECGHKAAQHATGGWRGYMIEIFPLEMGSNIKTATGDGTCPLTFCMITQFLWTTWSRGLMIKVGLAWLCPRALLHLFVVPSDSGRVKAEFSCNINEMTTLLHIMPDNPLFVGVQGAIVRMSAKKKFCNKWRSCMDVGAQTSQRCMLCASPSQSIHGGTTPLPLFVQSWGQNVPFFVTNVLK